MPNNYTSLAASASLTSTALNNALTELDTAIKLNNYAATTAPTVNDDAGDGYSVGSRWFDITNDLIYFCIDATVGAAIWHRMVKSASPTISGTLTQGTYRLSQVLSKAAIADNVATEIFKITTTDEASNDAGTYICNVTALVEHTFNGAAPYSTIAVKQYKGSFSRAMSSASGGVLTAVENVFSGASAAIVSGTRDIGTITMTVAENSEYDVRVSFQVDLTGSSPSVAYIVCFVELIYYHFLTPPVITGL